MATGKCGVGVTKSGGYWAGICKRPKGHTGPHRRRPTKADRNGATTSHEERG
jgi:hypothetical protein